MARPSVEVEGTKEKLCRGMGRGNSKVSRVSKTTEPGKQGMWLRGARQSSFEKLRFGKLKLLCSAVYCTTPPTSTRNRGA